MEMIEINEAFSVVALANIKVFTCFLVLELLVLFFYNFLCTSSMQWASHNIP